MKPQNSVRTKIFSSYILITNIVVAPMNASPVSAYTYRVLKKRIPNFIFDHTIKVRWVEELYIYVP